MVVAACGWWRLGLKGGGAVVASRVSVFLGYGFGPIGVMSLAL